MVVVNTAKQRLVKHSCETRLIYWFFVLDTIIFLLWGSASFPNRFGSCHAVMTAKLLHSRGCPPRPFYHSHLQLERYVIIVPRGTCKLYCESLSLPEHSPLWHLKLGGGGGQEMYSLFVRSNIGSQFHKVEHRLESLIFSRALFFLSWQIYCTCSADCISANSRHSS